MIVAVDLPRPLLSQEVFLPLRHPNQALFFFQPGQRDQESEKKLNNVDVY